MQQPKVIFMPHANIQYSQLKPERRLWVVQNCYEPLFDLIERGDYRIAFEASGKTIDFIAQEAPAVMEKLRGLIRAGKVEPVASPYIHFMLSNVPPELCVSSLRHGLDVWEKHAGYRPTVGWNPECGWAGYIPEVYREAGMETLVMDADSFFLSFEEIRKATGLRYDVEGHSNKNQLFRIEEYIADKPEFLQYITNPTVAENGLKLIFRSDCMANLLLWYLMGATEGMRGNDVNLDEIRAMYRTWHERVQKTGSFIMPYAEDAEYIGSSAYFYVKQFNQARFFEPEPQSIARFEQMMDAVKAEGFVMATPSEVAAGAGEWKLNPFVGRIENGVAWHGGTAKAWTNTRHARILDPVCRSIFEGIQTVKAALTSPPDQGGAELEQAMEALASAWVSDSRWPPEPTSPGRFNVEESVRDLYDANEALRAAMREGGIEAQKALYSPDLMHTQIRAAERRLMDMPYFGEQVE